MFLKAKPYAATLNKDGSQHTLNNPGEGLDHYKKLFSFSKLFYLLTMKPNAKLNMKISGSSIQHCLAW
jgi:hypothetical protein